MASEVFASGVATAPGAGAAIATIAAGSLPAGKYRVEVKCGVSGNAVADLANFRLRKQGVDVISPLPQGANGLQDGITVDEIDLNGSENLTCEAIGAGTASIEYQATISALKVGM